MKVIKQYWTSCWNVPEWIPNLLNLQVKYKMKAELSLMEIDQVVNIGFLQKFIKLYSNF